MRALVVTTKKYADSNEMDFLGVFNLGAKDLSVAVPNFCQPTFDPDSPSNAAYILIKVLAFSCNYRDKGLLLNNVQLLESGTREFLPFGSEFCGEILAVGKEVEGLKPGDRVMGNNAYPDSGVEGVLPGVATNFASLGYLRLHMAKVVLVPEYFSDEAAAAFSIGAQTAAGMIRASGILNTGGIPLVFSARSATSLFLIRQLNYYGLPPLCVTSSVWSEEEIKQILPAKLVEEFYSLRKWNSYRNYFTHVFDPFFDMNIDIANTILKQGGTYMTCGFKNQHPLLSSSSPTEIEPKVRSALALSIPKLLSLRGHCLGTDNDLRFSLEHSSESMFAPIIDSVYGPTDGILFLTKSFADPARFGKVVMKLDGNDC